MTQRPEEQEAVYTTIVGGRPPGCGTKVGEVPRGIEILVKKASVDAGFREALLTDRLAAAESIELTLLPEEKNLLTVIPEKQLEMIIDQTVVPKEQKPAFLGKIAATMLLALTLGLSAGEPIPSLGIRPDDERQNEMTDSGTNLLERKAKLQKEIANLEKLKVETGQLLDKEGQKKLKAELEKVIDNRLQKLRKELRSLAEVLAPTRGIRPERPTKGIRPDKPTIDNP